MTNACSSVEVPVEKLLTKFSAFVDSYNNSLDGLLSQIATLRRELLSDAESDSEITITAVLIWEHCLRKVRDVFGRLSKEHREMHGNVSKCGREIDHHFIDDFSGVCQKNCDYESDLVLRSKVDALIAKHFLTVGQIEISELLSKESNVVVDESNKSLFFEINSMLEALGQKNVRPALKWAQSHKNDLEQLNSQLLFNLHKMKFVEILRLGVSHQAEALKEAKVFQYFMDRNRTVHLAEVETLMGSLLFLRTGYEKSPYKELFSDLQWSQLCDMLSRDWCTIYNVPVNSPLSILLEAGTRAVPALLNIQQVMQQRHVSNIWGHSDELPIEIDLGPQNCYHSVFCCPILRQQTTDQNPPMRLSCGHVISREALIKLVTNNKLKCPYCPQESLISEARLIHF